ncbi:hypothetical protein RJT34_17376 [Clitoria ternatea]|uniref:DUF6857 domain-containing protein n=1 Tax=Clitoria ternatea TaxID=43366 RepID=A0AAN9J968_CLITE
MSSPKLELSYFPLFLSQYIYQYLHSAASEGPHVILNKFFTFQDLMDQPNGTTPHKDKSLKLNKISSPAETDKFDKKSDFMPGSKNTSKSPKHLTEISVTEKQEWAKENGVEDMDELREALLDETRPWFLEYYRRHWMFGFPHATKRRRESLEGEELLETVDRLKQKVYSCLLLHVDSAAFAMENRASF